jgi:hypothetical protein
MVREREVALVAACTSFDAAVRDWSVDADPPSGATLVSLAGALPQWLTVVRDRAVQAVTAAIPPTMCDPSVLTSSLSVFAAKVAALTSGTSQVCACACDRSPDKYHQALLPCVVAIFFAVLLWGSYCWICATHPLKK